MRRLVPLLFSLLIFALPSQATTHHHAPALTIPPAPRKARQPQRAETDRQVTARIAEGPAPITVVCGRGPAAAFLTEYAAWKDNAINSRGEIIVGKVGIS